MTAATFSQPAAGWVKPPQQGIAGRISTMVIDDVKHAAARAPRSLQTAIGPSEIGTTCVRRLAYKLLAWDEVNSDTDPWASVQGTSVHAWMAQVYEARNRALAEPRYLIEHRVHLPGRISGSCDLFDRETGAVIDWKLTGLPRIKEYRRNGPGQQYRVQAHAYGLGLLLAGEHPKYVADVFLPRGGRISDLHVWAEPFDAAVAAEYLTRLQTTITSLAAVDPEAHPERWALFPTADAHCTWCPFHLPMSADLARGCPGHRTIRPGK